MTGKLLIELLTPKQSEEDFEAKLTVFAQRFQKIMSTGRIVSIPDNPLGNLHFTAMEVLAYLDLPLDPERILVHLNSFHRRQDLDAILREMRDRGLKNLLVISGDGGPRLPKLEPEDLGIPGKAVTSVELLRYIDREHPGAFHLGAAYNPYEPADGEMEKTERKLDAGARFLITQPVIGAEPALAPLRDLAVPVSVGAWMSRRLDLLLACLGRVPAAVSQPYDPEANLRALRAAYPGSGLYLSQMPFRRDWRGILAEQADLAAAHRAG